MVSNDVAKIEELLKEECTDQAELCVSSVQFSSVLMDNIYKQIQIFGALNRDTHRDTDSGVVLLLY